MSEVEISSDATEEDVNSDVNCDPTQKNRNQFDKLLKLCQNRKEFPMKYIEDIDKMYKNCNSQKKNSTNLSKLIVNGLKYIPQQKSNSFQYVADIYNELLQLSKKDSTKSQVNNCTASTSSKAAVESGSENDIEVNNINKIFQELINKCYENPNFPNSKIKAVDNLYKSLPPEFIQSKFFVAMLEEANNKIWPDCGASLYVHLELIQEQLNQFKTSMEAQMCGSNENTKNNRKQLEKLKKLQVALKKVRTKIKYLDEAEMSISNDNDFDVNSSYVLKDRYEKRALAIYKRMCKIRKEPDFLEAPPLRFRQTNNKLVNKTIEKYYNLHKKFPDYYEIFTLFKVLNDKKKLNWTKTQLNEISHDAFIKLGKQLKIQRLDEYFSRLTDFTTDKDPAEENPELKIELDKSNKKLRADLFALKKKFIEKQKNIEETDGSSLNNTDCEISSEDDSGNMNNTLNKKTNLLPVKRKRLLSSNQSNDDNSPKKSKKSTYMESFNLAPQCVVALNKLDINMGTTSGANKVPDLALKKSIKDTNDSKQVTNEISRKGKKNVKNLVEEESIIDSNNDRILPIDDNNIYINGNANDTISKILQENNCTSDNEDNAPIITEPEVIIEEGVPNKDVIEINEFDDSDVEITESITPKVPVQNKESLESIIKAMNFEKQYKWGQQSVQNPVSPSTFNSTQSSVNNSNPQVNNFVNRWIMNNKLQHRPYIMHNRQPNHHNNFQRMQSSFQRSSTQTGRQVTQRFLNPIQQQRNFTNNQSVVSQRVTTMTTTTTVRQIVRQQSSVSGQQRMDSVGHQGQRPVSTKKNNSGKPELIELD